MSTGQFRHRATMPHHDIQLLIQNEHLLHEGEKEYLRVWEMRRAKSRYASINLAPALVRIRMLPFRTGDAGLSPHLLPLELELQDALLSLKHLRISQARGGGAPQLMLGAAVARFGKSTFVFAQVQDLGGIIVESVRAELKEDQYAACIRGIVPRLSSLLAHSEYLSSRRLINQ